MHWRHRSRQTAAEKPNAMRATATGSKQQQYCYCSLFSFLSLSNFEGESNMIGMVSITRNCTKALFICQLCWDSALSGGFGTKGSPFAHLLGVYVLRGTRLCGCRQCRTPSPPRSSPSSTMELSMSTTEFPMKRSLLGLLPLFSPLFRVILRLQN